MIQGKTNRVLLFVSADRLKRSQIVEDYGLLGLGVRDSATCHVLNSPRFELLFARDHCLQADVGCP